MTETRHLALYVHWPFCQAKCPYCDFNSHVVSAVDHDAWRTAFTTELERTARELPDRVLSSVFFGGGTPSLMEPETVDVILETAGRLWPSVNDLEVTLEANPTSVEASKFLDFRRSGISRVSVGLQALNDNDLKALGRLHTADEGRAAFDIARRTFDRCSFDLIYARQNQSLEDWSQELTSALELNPDHLSLYQLTIEPGTAFGDRFDRGRLPGLPPEDLAADMYELTQTLCEDAGLPAYETSNHARPGEASRHNLTYWSSEDWVGIGPGAHGRYSTDGTRLATKAHSMPTKWLEEAKAGSAEQSREAVPSDSLLEERLLMGLRMTDGIDIGKSINVFDNKLLYINRLTNDRLIERAGSRLRLTKQGRPLLNSVLRELLA